MTLHDLPLVNACLNTATAFLLLAGWIQIKRGHKEAHKKIMVTAFCVSSVFLASYLIHKFTVGPKLFPMQGWVRTLYFFILIPHTILAVLNLPFILLAVWFAATGQFEKHKKLTPWVWPIWMYVSVTGVLVYLMLYRWFA
jgi:putative membrane protein